MHVKKSVGCTKLIREVNLESVCWSDKRWNWKKTSHCVSCFFIYDLYECYFFKKIKSKHFKNQNTSKKTTVTWTNASSTFSPVVEPWRSSRYPHFWENVVTVILEVLDSFFFSNFGHPWGRWNSLFANEDSDLDEKFSVMISRQLWYHIVHWYSPLCRSRLQIITHFSVYWQPRNKL